MSIADRQGSRRPLVDTSGCQDGECIAHLVSLGNDKGHGVSVLGEGGGGWSGV